MGILGRRIHRLLSLFLPTDSLLQPPPRTSLFGGHHDYSKLIRPADRP
jgi:hypothetical protein